MAVILKNQCLFVYGSLRKGGRADLSHNPGFDFVGTDYISGKLYGKGCAYPMAKEVSDFGDKPTIYGEVYKIVDPEAMKYIDIYEGYPDLFGRKTVKTATGLTVWVYEYNFPVDPATLTTNGYWVITPTINIKQGE